ncbi:MAG TPA: hypothetical protein VFJ23_04890 [Candidatus Nitrosotalea sp.]|nr:hypothetical protein [Candidatus Nitrosotalea sp.]
MKTRQCVLRTVTILSLIAVVFLISSMVASQASAQQYPSGNRQFQGTRTPVNGTYTNSAFGVTVTIPDGWSGFEVKRTSGTTSVMVAPGGFHMQQGGPRSPIVMMLSMYPRNATTPAPQFIPRNLPQNETCSNDSNATKTVNGISLSDVVIDCSGQMQMKMEYDVAKTDSSYILLGYRSNSPSTFDSQVTVFDSMLGTLQIAGLGTPAVPEFPASFIGLAVAIMVGTVVILSRSKMMPNRS